MRQSRRKLLYELTLEELEAARALMEPRKAYQFSIAVSEIVRNYIEQRFRRALPIGPRRSSSTTC